MSGFGELRLEIRQDRQTIQANDQELAASPPGRPVEIRRS
jgi:hypothetical protein